MRRAVGSLLASALAVAALLSCWTRRSRACGPFFFPPVFTGTTQPDFPLGPYTRGWLGVLQSRYNRIFLYVAYRNLAGRGFDRAEALSLWNISPDSANLLDKIPAPSTSPLPSLQAPKDWPHDWIDERNKVPGAPHLDYIQPWASWQGIDRQRQGPNGNYASFINCPPLAFQTAIDTLHDRTRKLGAGSTELVSWVTAQDQVFSNCEKGENIPDPLPASASKPAHEDRQYQIAAAYFYATDFDKAVASFREIAADAGSPWSPTARYLIGRAYLRQATVGHDDNSPDSAALARAEEQLKTVLADSRLAEWHASATRLLEYTEVRLHPEQTVLQLARDLMQRQSGESLGPKVHDYTFLLDKLEGAQFSEDAREFDADRSRAFANLANLRSQDDLTDWIITFQDEDPAAFDHAYERWHSTRSPAWLVAAISKAQAGDSRAPELIRASRAVAASAPAYAPVTFHRLRLMTQTGERAAALGELNRVLAADSHQLPRSARYLFLALRMSFAGGLTEFLRYAPRLPVGINYNGYGGAAYTQAHPPPGSPWFDSDALTILNSRTPISVLTKAAQDRVLPDYLRRQVAIGAWTRAFLLGEDEAALKLGGVLGQLSPELRPALSSFSEASGPAERRFAGTFMILRFPGLRPYITSPERDTPLKQIDNLHENWWDHGGPCGMLWQSYPWQAENQSDVPGQGVKWPSLNRPLRQIYPSGEPSTPLFLTDNQLRTAGHEWRETQALTNAPDYLGIEAIHWVQQHPADPRAAEGLALVVRAGHYGCASKEMGKISRQAFEMLHRRYGSSSWARQTKYWYE